MSLRSSSCSYSERLHYRPDTAWPSLQSAQHLATLGAASSAFFAAGSAHADDSIVQAAETVVKATNDNRAALVAALLVPALGWVAYNILEPALGQYQNMRLK